MRVLVTGAGGQLGRDVVLHCERSGDEVIACDHATLDVADRDAVLGTILTNAPDVVIHAAAWTAVDACESDPDRAYAVNAIGTRWVADACRRLGAHLTYVSTDYVFDGTKVGPYVEWDAPNPQSVYGASKLGGEQEVGPDAAVVRTSWVCGQHGANMVKTILRLAAAHPELSFVDDQRGHPSFCADLAPTLRRIALDRRPGVHHVTNQGAVSWYEFVQAIMSAAGHDPDRVLPVSTADFLAARPADAPPMAPRPANSVLDNFALRHSGLGELRDFREPLAEVVAALGAAE